MNAERFQSNSILHSQLFASLRERPLRLEKSEKRRDFLYREQSNLPIYYVQHEEPYLTRFTRSARVGSVGELTSNGLADLVDTYAHKNLGNSLI